MPIGNGAMKDRTFIEWDKDDIDALGLMKVDILALGMLTAIEGVRRWTMLGIADMARHTREDKPTYDMLGQADTVGVFQVESRAQMNDAAAAEAARVLRSGDRGRHRAARPDPGRHGPPLPAPAGGAASR